MDEYFFKFLKCLDLLIFLCYNCKSKSLSWIYNFAYHFLFTKEENSIMLKRIIALLLCVATCLGICVGFASCGNKNTDDKGQSIIMYLPETIYDLDPAHAYNNKAMSGIVGLMFDTLFRLDENGKVKKGLVKDYKIKEDEAKNEYILELQLEKTYWSDGIVISANDVFWAWRRLLDPENAFEAAALLYDIKNARAVKSGDCSPDDLGVSADNDVLTIQFEQKIDYDQFMYNLTSVALAPLREDIANKGDDWAKKPSSMVTSGPFKLGRITFTDPNYAESNTKYVDPIVCDKCSHNYKEKTISSFIIERNAYYFRDNAKDEKIDKSVTPYRIIVDCSLDDEDILEAYENGVITYFGDIPYSLRNDLEGVQKSDALSTHSILFNQNALIKNKKTGKEEKLFANTAVRQALSLAIDREAILTEVVFGKLPKGLVPYGMTTSDSAKKTFREQYTNDEYLKYDFDRAVELLDEAGINAKNYSFSIQVPAYDDRQIAIAEIIVENWCELGFDVKLSEVATIANNDHNKYTNLCHTDMCDDMYAENLRYGRFEVISLDICAISADVFSMLAPFAKDFAGQGIDMVNDDEYNLKPHISGYDSDEYNTLMEEIFNEKNIDKRADKYAEAEKILMEDLPVIPVLHNEDTTLASKELKWNDKFLFWTTKSTYYGEQIFNKLEHKEYDEYLKSVKKFINKDRFEKYIEIKTSYLYSFRLFDYDEFKGEVSIYDFVFANEQK